MTTDVVEAAEVGYPCHLRNRVGSNTVSILSEFCNRPKCDHLQAAG